MLEEGKSLFLKEKDCGKDFFYILDDAQIVPTEYKVLHNQDDNLFIKCMNFKYNGQESLFYFTNNLKSLSNFFLDCNENEAVTVVSNLFKIVQKILNNGFLTCNHIDCSLKRIYVNPISLEVMVVYLPVNKSKCNDDLEFKSLLRRELGKGLNHFQSSKIEQFVIYLQNNNILFEDLIYKIKEVTDERYTRNDRVVSNNVIENKQLHLISVHPEQNIDILVNKDIYKLGRNPEIVDYAITFNGAIGRLHCQIDKRGNDYYVSDLNSANGTYVNNQRVMGQPSILKDNDILRLANLDFRVVMK